MMGPPGVADLPDHRRVSAGLGAPLTTARVSRHREGNNMNTRHTAAVTVLLAGSGFVQKGTFDE